MLKQLIEKGNMAKFSHYIAGNLYYVIDTINGSYQFPIKVVDKINDNCFTLSEDLGTTSFISEYKAITLMRYIRKAIEMEELIKIK